MSHPTTWRQPRTLFAEIATSQTTSNSCLLHGEHIVGVVVPDGFSGTALSFEAWDTDSEAWLPVHGPDGSQINLTVTGGRHVAIPPYLLPVMRQVRLKAGTAQAGLTRLGLVARAYE
jgi:hypothetical protein